MTRRFFIAMSLLLGAAASTYAQQAATPNDPAVPDSCQLKTTGLKAPSEKRLMGDTNGDGSVDMTDAIAIVYAFLGEAPTGFISEVADMNGDGLIDMSDAISVVYLFLSPGPKAEDQRDPQ